MADRIPDFREGPVYVEDFRDVADVLRASKPIAGPGIKVSRHPTGSVIEAAGGGGSADVLRRIEVPAGGIADGATVEVGYYRQGDSDGAPSGLMNVTNKLGTTTGGVSGKRGYAGWVQAEGDWQVIQEVCNL
jgi:hypothetical protein